MSYAIFTKAIAGTVVALGIAASSAAYAQVDPAACKGQEQILRRAIEAREDIVNVFRYVSTNQNIEGASQKEEKARGLIRRWNNVISRASVMIGNNSQLNEIIMGDISDIIKENSGFLNEIASINESSTKSFYGEIIRKVGREILIALALEEIGGIIDHYHKISDAQQSSICSSEVRKLMIEI